MKIVKILEVDTDKISKQQK